jgi:4-hydroxy-4-methyl-2-oxoglutarate aldolase
MDFHDFDRPDPSLIEGAKAFGTATLHEAAGQIGPLPSAIKPVAESFRLCGPAFTVLVPPRDNLWIHRALYAAQPGDVLVVDTGGVVEAGYFGAIMAHAAIEQQLGGLVVDGCVRDAAELKQLGFPVFCRGLCIRGTNKDKHGRGALGTPIRIGVIVIEPGDLIVGDLDGVVAIPHANVAEVVNAAKAREEKEAAAVEQIRAGARTLDLFGLD